MDTNGDKLAERIVRGLNVQPAELIDIRDDTGCLDMLPEYAPI